MSILLNLSTLAAGPVLKVVCEAAGLALTDTPADKLAGALAARFKDHSHRLGEALRRANERAWQALEVALAGDSWWQRVKGALGRKEDHALAGQIRAFLDATSLPDLQGKTNYREACLKELRAARKAGLLGEKKDPATAATAATNPAHLFTRFIDPRALFASESQLLDRIALELQQAKYGNLAHLLTLQARQGQSLLAIAARYFFRREVESDAELSRGLTFTQLETLQQGQEQAFAALQLALDEQGDRLEGLLVEVQVVVAQTHEAVLDIQDEQRRQGDQARDIYQAVTDLQRRLDLMQREVRPRDSLSIRTDAERHLVKQVVARYRALPEEQRRGLPALLNAVGKLEVAAGDFETAQRDFDTVATLVSDTQAKGEAHANAYQAALERRDWSSALRELIEAVKLDGRRFAPFPVGKYHPQCILGAGGFGVAFLCKHKYMDAQVVVKALMLEDLGRDADKVFTEAKVLRQLDHPAIIRIADCGFADAATKSRPFLVMDYFKGETLEEYVKEAGPLAPADLLTVARLMADALRAAHSKGILHRDVKPANVLVCKDETGWHVKLIDFGLALKQSVLEVRSTQEQRRSITGTSIAGTIDYAAPEQLGKRKAPVGPPADIFGFAKTCCYALFQTPQPLPRHWRTVPAALAEVAELLESCLEDQPTQRPQDFDAVLERLVPRIGTPEEGDVENYIEEDLRPAHVEALKDAGDYAADMTEDDEVPKWHKALLRHYNKALYGVADGIENWLAHLADLTKAEDVAVVKAAQDYFSGMQFDETIPSRHKSALAYHSARLGPIHRSMRAAAGSMTNKGELLATEGKGKQPPEADTAARWEVLKTLLQKQVRASDWGGARQTVDAMLAIKPYDRDILEARDYLEKRRDEQGPPLVLEKRRDEEGLPLVWQGGSWPEPAPPKAPASLAHVPLSFPGELPADKVFGPRTLARLIEAGLLRSPRTRLSAVDAQGIVENYSKRR